MHILAISGSLRATSINLAFCRLVSRLAVAPVHVSLFTGLGELPLFNPDLEASPPGVVQNFRHTVGQADALLIASPEYAHGISGVMKNALDWLVSYEGTAGKPVSLINTSPRAHHAYDALREVLHTMSAKVVDAASFSIPLLGACTTEEAMLTNPDVCRAARTALDAISRHVLDRDVAGPSFPIS